MHGITDIYLPNSDSSHANHHGHIRTAAASCYLINCARYKYMFMQTVNVKELFGFLPHQSLEVYTGTIHAKKCKKVVLYFLIPYFELRIFSGEYERMEYH